MTDGSTTIPFTQFIRPDGRATEVLAPMPKGCEDKVKSILGFGWTFEAEVLMPGLVCLSVSDGSDDMASVVSPNGPEIGAALIELIDKAFRLL